MKAKLILAVGASCLGILVSGHSFAGGCGHESSCPDVRCTPPESPCACTDPGWRWNKCMSKSRYCEAFGNVGSLDEE